MNQTTSGIPSSAIPALSDRILSRIQTDFPLAARPYAALGDEFGCSEAEALAAVSTLRADVIRRIGATFDPSHLGYVSTLAAISVPEGQVEAAAAIVNGYGEVTHNYLRNDAHNIWFTVIAPARERIEAVLAEIAARVACAPALDLPATRLFKIRVNFDVAGLGDEGFRQRTVVPAEVAPLALSPAEVALVVAAQGSIDNTAKPFAALGETCGMSAEEVISTLGRWKADGAVRRFGAVVRHRAIGVTANAMTVWDVPDDRALAAGELMAGFSEVSHCYERPRREEWPHNLYTMIHATTPEGCQRVADRIRAACAEADIQVPAPRLLFSSREFKKRSMRYFAESGVAGARDAKGEIISPVGADCAGKEQAPC